MVLCAVAGCRAYYNIKTIKTNNGEPLSFFHLPHDPELKAEWMARCRIEDTYNLKNARVCSLHFQKDDFDSSYRTKCAFGLKPVRPSLHKYAVPSLRLPSSGLDSLLEEYAGEDDELGAVHAPDGGATPPLDPEQRAAIVEEAIADMLRREQEQCDENLQLLSSLSAPRKKTPGERAAAKKRKMASRRSPSAAIDGTITSMRSEVFLLPKGGPIIRKVTFVKPEPEPDEDDDDLDDLGRQLKEIRRMQRQTSTLEQKLATKQRQLQEVLLQQAAAHAALVSLTGRKVGRRKRVDVEGGGQTADSGLFSAGDPLMVLRSEEEPAELAVTNDMLSVPADLIEAKRIIFSLRQEVLALRNSTLKHAHTATTQRIDAIGKEVKRDVRQAAIVKRLRDALSSVFSRAQQSRVLKGKKILPWESEDYMRAIALRRLCRRRTFEFVRNTMKIPLPSMFALRSAAAFGRFPEVTRGFKELREQKRLHFITGPARTKQASVEREPLETEVIASVDMPEQMTLERLEPVERQSPRRRVGRGRGGRGRGGAGALVARKRKWQSEQEQEEDELVVEAASPQKQCWNAVDLTELIEFEHDEHSSSMDDAWSRHVQSSLDVLDSPRGRGRGRGRGVSRQGAPRAGPPGGGKRVPSHSGNLTFAQEL